MKLIVGLGNPGMKYHETRHNIGFDVIDYLASELGVTNFRDKFNGEIGEAIVDGEKVFLLKPMTFMNLSGDSIREVVKFYKLDPVEDLIVIYDDMDITLGKLKIKRKGRAGGHNGVKSIISHVGDEFIRIKCGIGKPKRTEEVINFVLDTFSKKEREEEILPLIETASKAAKSMITAKSIERVIEKFNRK